MDFKEFLVTKHLLIKGESKLKEISADQYSNRLKSLRNNGIYKEEMQLDSQLTGEIQDRYKDWTKYVKTIKYCLEYRKYSQ